MIVESVQTAPSTSVTSPCRYDVTPRPATSDQAVFRRLWKPNDVKTTLLTTPSLGQEDTRWKSRLHATLASNIRSCQSMLRPAASYAAERGLDESTRENRSRSQPAATQSLVSRSHTSESRVRWHHDVSFYGSEYTFSSRMYRPKTHGNLLRRSVQHQDKMSNGESDKENNGLLNGNRSKMSVVPLSESRLGKKMPTKRESQENIEVKFVSTDMFAGAVPRPQTDRRKGRKKPSPNGRLRSDILENDAIVEKGGSRGSSHRLSISAANDASKLQFYSTKKRTLSRTNVTNGNVTNGGVSSEAAVAATSTAENDDVGGLLAVPRSTTRPHGRTMSTPKLLPSTEDQQALKAKRGMLKRQKTFIHSPAAPAELPPSRSRIVPETERRFRNDGDAREFFRRTAKKVNLVLSWMQVLSKKDKDIDRTLKSFLDIATDLEDSTAMQHIQEASGLSFDPNFYRAKKDIRLTDELKTILTLPPDARTPDMVQKVLHALQGVEAFAEYPPHMQQKFARVAWYHPVEGKRLILKQGHIAENFYFILTGTAIVKKLIEDNTGDFSMRAVARMQKGQAFGELALLHNLLRTATVESMNNMELLMIGAQDFHRIFFNAKDGEEPDHIKYCRKVDFLELFPMEKCVTTPGTCVYHYFRPGTVVVHDSTKNDWIYIVKSGSCQVIKKLQGVNAQRPKAANKSKEQELHLPRIECKIDSRIRKSDSPRSKSAELANEKAPATGRLMKYLMMTGSRAESEPIILPPAIAEQTIKLQELSGSMDININIPQHKQNKVVLEEISTDSKAGEEHAWDLEAPETSTARDDDKKGDDEEEESYKHSESESCSKEPDSPPEALVSPAISERSEPIERKRRKTLPKTLAPLNNVRLKAPPRDKGRPGAGSETGRVWEASPRPVEVQTNGTEVCNRQSDNSETSSLDSGEKPKKIVTFASEKSKPSESPPATRTVSVDGQSQPRAIQPCFVMLKRLRPKEAFGLEDVVFDDDKKFDTTLTPVTLVSNGAELVMLSRRFFAKHANETVRQFVRKKTRPYPSEETLQLNLQTEVNWDLFRKGVVDELISERRDAKDILPVIL